MPTLISGPFFSPKPQGFLAHLILEHLLHENPTGREYKILVFDEPQPRLWSLGEEWEHSVSSRLLEADSNLPSLLSSFDEQILIGEWPQIWNQVQDGCLTYAIGLGGDPYVRQGLGGCAEKLSFEDVFMGSPKSWDLPGSEALDGSNDFLFLYVDPFSLIDPQQLLDSTPQGEDVILYAPKESVDTDTLTERLRPIEAEREITILASPTPGPELLSIWLNPRCINRLDWFSLIIQPGRKTLSEGLL